MQTIPKIIHQVWSGIDGDLPTCFEEYGETWKTHYPEWKYELWNHQRMNDFVQQRYPQYWDMYNNFPYHIQRWDAIRYLILYEMGGLYADFDYESIKSMEEIIVDKSCCFSAEPTVRKKTAFNNALMISLPKNWFMKKIIKNVFSEKNVLYQKYPKGKCVMNTTGPWMLMKLYEALSEEEKESIYLIPAECVTPIDWFQAQRLNNNVLDKQGMKALEDAYAVHRFFGTWWENDTI